MSSTNSLLTKWDYRFIELAQLVATWSKDSKKVGAVMVDSETNKVLSLGFNGMPSWYDDNNLDKLSSIDKGLMITHAEFNALDTLSRHNFNKDITLYVTKPPCSHCSQFIVNSLVNVKRVVYMSFKDSIFNDKYCTQDGRRILEDNSILVQEYCGDEDV